MSALCKVNIVLASGSKIKLEAVKAAFQSMTSSCKPLSDAELNFFADLESSSGVPNQPIGLDQTFDGCLNRINSIKSAHIYDYLVAIENGIVVVKSQMVELKIDMAVVMIKRMSNGKLFYATSGGIPFCNKDVAKSLESGQQITAGQFMCDRLKEEEGLEMDHQDPHWVLTLGHFKRSYLLSEAIKCCISQSLY